MQRLTQRLIRPIIFALTAWFAADAIAVLGAEQVQARSAAAAPRPERGPDRGPPLRDRPWEAIVARDLFAASSRGPSVDPNGRGPDRLGAPVSHPPSTLPLELVGTVVASDGHASVAVVRARAGVGDRGQRLVRLGTALGPDATVARIEAHRLVLERAGGALEELLLEVAPLGASPRRTGVPDAVELPDGSSGAGVHRGRDGVYVVERAYFDEELENLPQTLRDARRTLHHEGGAPVGLRLSAIRSGSIFDRIGLRRSDVIRSVNGVSLADPGAALTHFEDLRRARSFDVVVLRGGREQALRYEVD